jgi:hypothetical protein
MLSRQADKEPRTSLAASFFEIKILSKFTLVIRNYGLRLESKDGKQIGSNKTWLSLQIAAEMVVGIIAQETLVM